MRKPSPGKPLPPSSHCSPLSDPHLITAACCPGYVVRVLVVDGEGQKHGYRHTLVLLGEFHVKSQHTKRVGIDALSSYTHFAIEANPGMTSSTNQTINGLHRYSFFR